jgi:hypothetical protein
LGSGSSLKEPVSGYEIVGQAAENCQAEDENGRGLESARRAGDNWSAAFDREVPVEPTEIDRLLTLADLLERKLLTRQEFEEERRFLLERQSASPA